MNIISEQIDYCLMHEIVGARAKFPENKYKLAALVEEVGELSQALIDNSRGKQTNSQVFKEAIQVAAMALRIAAEGDDNFPYEYSRRCYVDFKPTSTMVAVTL